MRPRLVFLALLFALAAPAVPLPAQAPPGGVSADVHLSEVTAAPGEVAGDRVKAINLTGREVRVAALIRDVGAGADGDTISVARGTGAPSAALWVRSDPAQFTLAAGGTQEIAIRVSVPAGTPAGGYYASVVFDAAGVEARRTSEHHILVRVPGDGLREAARIVAFRMPRLSVGGPVDIGLEVANAGNVHVILNGQIRITDQFGNNLGRLEIASAMVLPGHQRLLTIRWSSPPPLARIRAVAQVDLGGREAGAQATGFALAWWVIAAVGLAFVLPGYGLARRGRRRRRAAREAAEAERRPAPPVAPVAPSAEGAWPGMQASAAEEEVEEAKPKRRKRAKVEAEQSPPAPTPPRIAVTPPVAGPRRGPIAVTPSRPPAGEPLVLRREESPEPDLPAAETPTSPARPPAPPAPRPIEQAPMPPSPMPPAPVPSAWHPDADTEALSGAAALRRAKVALDMLGGPTGETGAILDAALELLRSVRRDPGVIAAVAETYEANRARRRAGPLALALAVVESSRAPAALLEAYAAAPKVVADRVRKAISACDPAELRQHPGLIEALPPARRSEIDV